MKAVREVFCVGYSRTPITKMGANGKLAPVSATKLGAAAIQGALKQANQEGLLIDEAFMGNVVSAGIGQAPARQSVLYAGLSKDIPCTTVNKVCASGMKAAMFGSMSISSGYRNAIIAGGMESMSNIPFYLQGARKGYRLGNNVLTDGLIHDGLWDVYNNQHMGNCGELCADTYKISREEQDDYSIRSYKLAAECWNAGITQKLIAPVSIPNKNKDPIIIDQDDNYSDFLDQNNDGEKVRKLRAAFKKEGTITAGNASSINDGAAAMILVSGDVVKELNLKPLFKISGYGDAAQEPVEFTTAPAKAIPKALEHAGMTLKDVQYHEINEAFAVVPIACAKILDLDINTVNVHGGAIAYGHPIGCSGARIIGTMYQVLKDKDATIGCASICNGGGGASAIIIERLD